VNRVKETQHAVDGIGVIIFLLWLWLANLSLLFGAEFDAELERGRELHHVIELEVDEALDDETLHRIARAAGEAILEMYDAASLPVGLAALGAKVVGQFVLPHVSGWDR